MRIPLLALAISILALALAISAVLIVNTLTLRIEVYTLRSRCDLVVAQVSDLHIPSPSPPPDRVVHALKEANPNLIVFTGDYVSRKSGLKNFEEFLKALRRELPKARILGCLGNWDRRLGLAKSLAKVFEEVGGELLINEVEVLEINGCRVCLVGLDDGLEGFPKYDVSCPPNVDIRIALVHEPELAIALAKRGFEGLIFAGHCHGGQIRIFGRPLFLPPMCPRNMYEGLRIVDKALILVNPGLGTSVIPIRFGCEPRIYVVKLMKS